MQSDPPHVGPESSPHVGPESSPRAGPVLRTESGHRAGPTSRYDSVKLATEAKQALVGLRFPKSVARDAVALALEELGHDVTLERLIFDAIRRCGR